MSLWQIVAELNDAIEASAGEITTEVEELFNRLSEKTDNVVEVISAMKAAETHHRELASKQADAAKRCATLAEGLKRYAFIQAKINGGALVGNSWSIKVTKCKPSLIVNDESQVPNKFKFTKEVTSVDKNLIHEALKLGEFVPGVELTGGETIRIGAV
jgi:hypothetical protein